MLDSIWAVMILLSFLTALMTGRLPQLSTAIGDGAQHAVETSFLLLGGMCLWSGIMRIAEGTGLVRGLSRCLTPVIRKLFPKYSKNEEIREKIALNMAANMFGMGNAATPAGLAVMDAMQKYRENGRPDREMIRFVVMNTAAFQIIPSGVVMLRSSYGSENPYDVMAYIWLVSFGSLFTALSACRLFERLWDR